MENGLERLKHIRIHSAHTHTPAFYRLCNNCLARNMLYEAAQADSIQTQIPSTRHTKNTIGNWQPPFIRISASFYTHIDPVCRFWHDKYFRFPTSRAETSVQVSAWMLYAMLCMVVFPLPFNVFSLLLHLCSIVNKRQVKLGVRCYETTITFIFHIFESQPNRLNSSDSIYCVHVCLRACCSWMFKRPVFVSRLRVLVILCSLFSMVRLRRILCTISNKGEPIFGECFLI